VNHVIPGVDIDYYSKLPEIGGDLIFAFSLGFALSLIYPIIVIFKVKPTHFKVGLSSFLIAFIAYSIVNLLPVGIKVSSPSSYVWTSLIVWFMGYITNHLELRRYINEKERKEKEIEKETQKDADAQHKGE
jgi:uncharacterized membrane protein YvlD (DUF360 family)